MRPVKHTGRRDLARGNGYAIPGQARAEDRARCGCARSDGSVFRYASTSNPAASDPTGGTDRADPLSKLRDSYTMHAERTVAAQPGDDVASEAEDCDVELF